MRKEPELATVAGQPISRAEFDQAHRNQLEQFRQRLGAQFDPARDPADDLATAKVEAQRGKKRILLEVGNAACDRCQALDELVEGNGDLRRFRDAHYVSRKWSATTRTCWCWTPTA
ncbi:hypothetical protein G6F63_015744 [Rhizopus arrhizus]|nr:hypothetical protein G6F63_015744 [Rhizopus arrhizus]